MIERQILSQYIREFEIQEYISSTIKGIDTTNTKVQRSPLGEKIILSASRPGLVVGRRGQNIKNLTKSLKSKFKLENPEVEITEVTDPDLNPQIIAEKIAMSLERFGPSNFKGIGHKVMEAAMKSGALGIEIIISGKIPSSRARRWRFYQGYLKKCGDLAIVGVKKAYASAHLKTGVVGIQVRVMPSDIKLPDKMQLLDLAEEVVEVVDETTIEETQKTNKEDESK